MLSLIWQKPYVEISLGVGKMSAKHEPVLFLYKKYLIFHI